MARNRIGMSFTGWKEVMTKLDEIGGDAAMKRAVESGMKASKQYINSQIEPLVRAGNLPAGGKYSTGDVKRSIDKDMNVEWEHNTAVLPIGFDFKKSGTTSIFLIYGTPDMAPVRGLKAAIYGAKTQKKIGEIQEEAVTKAMERIMRGE